MCCLKSFLFVVLLTFQFFLKQTCAISTNSFNETKTRTLKMVQIIIRHGDRAPIEIYPNDPYKNESVYWPEGWGQLTQIGIKQQFELGKYFRNGYDDFLPRKYFYMDFVAQSSDVDRAIQSADANLRGLYPPKNNTNSDNSLEWQFVPIHTIPSDNDIYLDVKREGCPKYMQHVANFQKKIGKLKDTNSKFAEFINWISEKAGTNKVGIINVQDAIKCEQAHNLSLPDWATEDVLIKLDKLYAIGLTWLFQTQEMKRLRGGPLIRKLLDNFNVHNQKLQRGSRKMHLFSGHDLTLAAVLSTWEIFDNHIPAYASALMIELHKQPGDSEPYVQLYYRNETKREPYNSIIPKCGSPCWLTKLFEISTNYFPIDWDKECQLTSASPFETSDTEDDLFANLVESLGFSNKD